MADLSRATGACAAAAGVALTAAALVHGSLPEGCLGRACELGGSMRGATPAGEALFLLAGALLALSVGGMLLLARRVLGPSRPAVAAAVVSGLGLALLLAAGLVSAFVHADWSGMPFLVGPGIAAVAVGLALVAVAVHRARLLPRSWSLLLLVTVLLLPLANEQTSRVLLAIPFGLAWVAVGAVVWRRGGPPVVSGAAAADVATG